MGANDRENEIKENKTHKARNTRKKPKFAAYVDFKIAKADRKKFRKEQKDDAAVISGLAQIIEGDDLTLTVSPAADGSHIRATLHDHTAVYVERVYLATRHTEVSTALAMLEKAYNTVYMGIPPDPRKTHDDTDW